MIKLRFAQAMAKASFDVQNEGAAMFFAAYGYAGKKIVPFSATAQWKLTPEGTWRLFTVTVSGTVLKADGTKSKNDTVREAYRAMEWAADAPQWLKDAVQAHDPQIGRVN